MHFKQKNILFGVTLLGCTSLMASSYVGLDLSHSQNSISGGVTSEIRTSNNSVALKYAYGKDGNRKYQGCITYYHYSDPLFDDSNKDLYDMSFDFIQEFDAQHNIYPYLKIGLGLGSMPIDNASKSNITSLSFNAGFGISFKLPEHFYLVTGFEYLGRSWQDIKYTTTSEKTLSTYTYGLGLYVGVNYGF